jgi:ATP-dependent RNA helicase DDX3X
MESFFNPFENRYPNRRKVMAEKDREAEDLIKQHKNYNYEKNVESLNFSNKELNLFIGEKQEKVEGIDFPEKFFDYGQIPNLIKDNLKTLEFETLTPIQKLFFGYLFNYKNMFFDRNKTDNNYDLIGCAQTGSGKTLAYLIPAVSFLFNDFEGINQIKSGSKYGYTSYPLILVITPTRELAIQTYEEALKLLYKTYINTVVVFGGEKPFIQQKELYAGCDIVIGTPGRLIDFLERGVINLIEVKFLVIDEADKLLDMGFEDDINTILYEFKWSKNFSIFLTSATFPKKVLNMVNRIMRKDYSYITHGNCLGEDDDANGNVKQRFYYIDERYTSNLFKKKIEALLELLKIVDGKTLIFANKKSDVWEIAREVDSYGYGINCLVGDMDMGQRMRSLEDFKQGKINLLVASDVASRGLDIPEVSFVINFDMPNNIDVYVHRIGRTGRVGNKGSSLTLLSDSDRPIFRQIYYLLLKSGQNIPQFLR